jgi:hypothetical protein
MNVGYWADGDVNRQLAESKNTTLLRCVQGRVPSIKGNGIDSRSIVLTPVYISPAVLDHKQC